MLDIVFVISLVAGFALLLLFINMCEGQIETKKE